MLKSPDSELTKPSENIRLFVQDVLEFSSQYGKENSNSYTVANVRSRPHYYPKYGDFLESSVFRTYGPWWSSPTDKIPIPAQPLFISSDYIEVKFEHKLLIESVIVYETYNPGAVCVMYAFDYTVKSWVCIWSIFHENNFKSNTEACDRALPVKASRKFEPILTRKNVFSDKIRLEFEHSRLDYYTELDAVEISGVAYDIPKTNKFANELIKTASIFENLPKGITSIDIDENKDSSASKRDPDQTPQTDTKILSRMSSSKSCKEVLRRNSSVLSMSEKNKDMVSCSNIVDLPNEILCMVLTYLDLKTVFRLKSTCQTFYDLCSLGFLFNKLDLQPYWHLIDADFIEYLSTITDKITMLNLSWVKVNRVEPIRMLFESSCENLTVLQLNSCSFMNGSLLTDITRICIHLTSLSLRSCTNIESVRDECRDGFVQIRLLKKLTTLDLYRTLCGQTAICEILASCSRLKSVNLGSCIKINDYDQVMSVIGKSLTGIRCLDLWRAYSLTGAGVNMLSQNCLELEELDIGWCRSVAPIYSIQDLIKNCKNIKKLFLTSLKVTDVELELMSKYSTKLEKLDILGSNLVSSDGVVKVLHNCKSLKMFDISFCNKIDVTTQRFLSEIYLNCSIKKSFQSEI